MAMTVGGGGGGGANPHLPTRPGDVITIGRDMNSAEDMTCQTAC